jgi:hypothetical protein
MRLACALAMRTSSLVCSKRSAKSPTCFASFFRSMLLGMISRGRRTPSTRGRRARLIAARAASPSAAVPASAPSAPFAIVARPLTDCARVLSAVAVDPSCCRRAEALGERRLAAELDPDRLRAELDAFLVVAAPARLELCLPGERDELPLGLFGVATEPPWIGVRQLASQGTASVNRSTKAGSVLRLGPTRVTVGPRSGADRRAAHPVPGRNGHPAGGQPPPSRREVCGLPRSNLVPQPLQRIVAPLCTQGHRAYGPPVAAPQRTLRGRRPRNAATLVPRLPAAATPPSQQTIAPNPLAAPDWGWVAGPPVTSRRGPILSKVWAPRLLGNGPRIDLQGRTERTRCRPELRCGNWRGRRDRARRLRARRPQAIPAL